MSDTRWAAGRWGLVPRLLLFAVSLAALALLVLMVGAFGAPEPEVLNRPGWSFAISFALIILLSAILALYIVDILANPRLNDTARAIWGFALFVGNVIAMPAYWLVHLSRRRA